MKCEISCRLCPFPNCVLTDQEAVEREILDELWKDDPDAVWSDARRVLTNRRESQKKTERYHTDPEFAEKVRADAREYAKKHRKERTEYMQKWRAKHPDRQGEYQRTYRRKHKGDT